MRRTRTKLAVFTLGALGAAAFCGVLLGPAPAHACGGLFCNSPPPDPFAPLPVAQTGENVAFGVDTDATGAVTTVTAHIQILYTGPADKFSWVVPVDAVPELSTGTDQLFTTLAQRTQPVFVPQYILDGQCRAYPTGSGGFADASAGTGSGGFTGTGTGGTSGGPGVTVSFQGAVGPFDAAVISSPDGAELRKWLTDNGYFVGPDAVTLIDDYVREGKVFVALKLLNGKDVRSIRPIVLTFRGTEPCVPLRLTAIAALPDMQVRVWVLGPSRAVPRRFFELSVDQMRINWTSGGSNYPSLLAEAANEAGGNAFAAEYAGPSSMLAGALWTPTRFDLSGLRAAQTPPAAVQALLGLGIGNDPQTLPLLSQYIPMPDAVRAMGISESQFYSNISFYWLQNVFPPFDLAMLAAHVDSDIIAPRQKAQAMIDAHPYLTRLNTFISPLEMTQDPLFSFNPDLPDVSAVRGAVIRTLCGNQQFLYCNAPMRLELPDGRMAWMRAGSTASTCANLPTTSTFGTLPASEVVWERDDSGEGARRIDNTAVIQAALTQHNIAFAAEMKMFPIPVIGQGGSSGQTGGPIDDGPGGRGCGCDVGGAGGVGGMLALSALALSAASRRLGRRRKP